MNFHLRLETINHLQVTVKDRLKKLDSYLQGLEFWE